MMQLPLPTIVRILPDIVAIASSELSKKTSFDELTIAFNSIEANLRILNTSMTNVIDFINGKELRSVV